jgi:hypothetical protein
MDVKTLLARVLALTLCAFPAMAEEGDSHGHMTNLEKRIEKLEKADDPETGDRWFNCLEFSGLIEVEAGIQELDFDDPAEEDEKCSEVDLAVVELALIAPIVQHVDGHVLIKYEEEDVYVDEGFIILNGPETFPAYLIAGRQYVPFGHFDSHFITDPNTLILGETNAGAVVAGYQSGEEVLDLSLGAFNGKIDEGGDDDTINGFVASVSGQPWEGVSLGVSYISNLASSDAFSEVVTNRDGNEAIDPVEDLVGGWSAFVALNILDRFSLMGEYVAALDSFKAGEIYDPACAEELKPGAWNLESGFAFVENLELAVRYGGSDDGGEFLPDAQYGAVVNWRLFENTKLAAEYLHEKFGEDKQEVDLWIARLAIEF